MLAILRADRSASDRTWEDGEIAPEDSVARFLLQHLFMFRVLKILRRVFRESPESVKKKVAGQCEKGIRDLEQALALYPKHRFAHYNIACYYCQLGKKEEAFGHLATAIENGYTNALSIQSDPDLAFLKIQQEFAWFAANGYRHPVIRSVTDVTSQAISASNGKSPPTESQFQDQKLRIIDALNRGKYTHEVKKHLARGSER
jgi:tetratricopeptide (TPR) repeat protein